MDPDLNLGPTFQLCFLGEGTLSVIYKNEPGGHSTDEIIVTIMYGDELFHFSIAV